MNKAEILRWLWCLLMSTKGTKFPRRYKQSHNLLFSDQPFHNLRTSMLRNVDRRSFRIYNCELFDQVARICCNLLKIVHKEYTNNYERDEIKLSWLSHKLLRQLRRTSCISHQTEHFAILGPQNSPIKVYYKVQVHKRLSSYCETQKSLNVRPGKEGLTQRLNNLKRL